MQLKYSSSEVTKSCRPRVALNTHTAAAAQSHGVWGIVHAAMPAGLGGGCAADARATNDRGGARGNRGQVGQQEKTRFSKKQLKNSKTQHKAPKINRLGQGGRK
jgi:hypothetical protein